MEGKSRKDARHTRGGTALLYCGVMRVGHTADLSYDKAAQKCAGVLESKLSALALRKRSAPAGALKEL